MKKLFTLLVLAFFTLPLFSQSTFMDKTTDQEYMLEAPGIPADLCSMSGNDIDTLAIKISRLRNKVDEANERYMREVDDFMKANEENARQNAAAQAGMSSTDMQKLQSGKLSEGEKKAIADKMMQQQLNMSMDQAKDISKMTKEEKEAWAQTYAMGKQANGQVNPSAYKPDQQRSMKLIELTKLRTNLNDSLASIQKKFSTGFQKIEEDPALQPSRDSIKVWTAKWMSVTIITSDAEAQEMAVLAQKICAEKHKLCSMFTSGYLKLLKEYSLFVKSSMKAYYRLEKANFDFMELQTGVKYPCKPGKAGLANVAAFLDRFTGSMACYSECTSENPM